MLLGALLQPFPLARAQGRHARGLPVVLALVFRHLVERVNAHVDAVAPLILNLDHLLMATVGQGHAHQAAELADAVVHVNHVVAQLELLNLLQRQGHLATACLVALQVVLVEAVEDLVVGEEAHPQVVVDEALVQRAVYGSEKRRVVSGEGQENLLQPLVLLLAVGQYVDGVPLQLIVLEGLGEQVEVLVEERLGRCVEADAGLGQGRGAIAELYAAEGLAVAHELPARNDLALAAHLALYLVLLHLGGPLHALHHSLRREAFLVGAVDGIARVHIIFKYQHRVARQESQQRLLLLYAGHLGHNADALLAVARQLVLDLEGTYGVDVVAKEVYAEGVFVAEGEHVEDAAAQGELSRLVDVVNLAEAELAQLLADVVNDHRLPLLQGQRALVQVLARHHHLGNGLGVGHDVEARGIVRCVLGCQPAQCLRAQNFAGGIFLRILYGAAVARGEEEHLPVAHHLRQVVIEVASLVGILQHEEQRVPALRGQGAEQHRCA